MTDDPAATYAEKSREADTRFAAWYWDARFVASVTRTVLAETPGLLRDDLARARRFLTGSAESLGVDCRISGCERDAAAYLNGGRPYATRRPVCERHYLAVKGGAVALVVLLAVASVASAVYLGVMLS